MLIFTRDTYNLDMHMRENVIRLSNPVIPLTALRAEVPNYKEQDTNNIQDTHSKIDVCCLEIEICLSLVSLYC